MSADLSIITLITKANVVVKIIMMSLFLMSIWCWYIVFDKLIKFRMIEYFSIKFEKKFWSGILLEEYYEEIKKNAKHPMAKIFVAAMREWEASDVKNAISNINQIKDGIRDRISVAMLITRDKVYDGIRRGLSILASAGAISPFVGLFGTVWGIMHSFQSIANSKNTSLSVVAPGIAEALLATAIGLLVAIPAVIFYNLLSNKVADFCAKFEEFSLELTNILSRELDSASSRSNSQSQPYYSQAEPDYSSYKAQHKQDRYGGQDQYQQSSVQEKQKRFNKEPPPSQVGQQAGYADYQATTNPVYNNNWESGDADDGGSLY